MGERKVLGFLFYTWKQRVAPSHQLETFYLRVLLVAPAAVPSCCCCCLRLAPLPFPGPGAKAPIGAKTGLCDTWRRSTAKTKLD